MGVPGFVSWLETHSPEALVEIPLASETAPPREVEVVAFDLNSLVHNALRNARNEDQAITFVFQALHRALQQVQPRRPEDDARHRRHEHVDGLRDHARHVL